MTAEPQAPAGRFRRNFGVTLLGQVAVAIGGLLLYRLLALDKGAAGVGSYAVVKQVVIFAVPTVMLGLQTAIPRYVALSGPARLSSEAYLLAATAIMGVTLGVVALVALISPPTTAALLFGDPKRTYLVVPLVATLAATIGFEIAFGYLRGLMDFTISAALRIVGVAALPVVLLLAIPSASIGTLMTLMAVGLFALCALVVAPPLARAIRRRMIRPASRAGRTLLNYGYRRIPGELAGTALFALPPVIGAHVTSLREVGYLSTGMLVLGVMEIALQPIGVIFLPVLARLCATDWAKAREYVVHMTAAGLHLGAFVTPQLVLFVEPVTRAWLGPAFAHAGTVIRITVLPAAALAFFVVMRSALDAASVKAYNARNGLVSFASFGAVALLVLGLGLGRPIEGVAWSFDAGIFCLGFLTFLSVRSMFGVDRSNYALGAMLLLVPITAGLGYLTRIAVGANPSLPVTLLIIAVEFCLAAFYVAALVRAGIAWPGEIRRRLRA